MHPGCSAIASAAVAHDPGKVNRQRADRLAKAAEALEAAQQERTAAIVDALEHGASLRIVAELLQMSESGVRKIALAAGYTADRFHAERRRQRELHDELAKSMGLPPSKPDATELRTNKPTRKRK